MNSGIEEFRDSGINDYFEGAVSNKNFRIIQQDQSINPLIPKFLNP
jgi:translation initiation factor RLI1